MAETVGPVTVEVTPGGPVIAVEVEPGGGARPDPHEVAVSVSAYLNDHPVLPDQSGHAGGFLSTDGAVAEWSDLTPPVTLSLLFENALV